GVNEIDFSKIPGAAAASTTWGAYWPRHAFVKTATPNAQIAIWCSEPYKPLPQSIWYKFDEPVTVTKFSFKGWPSGNADDYSPSKYQLFGSNHDADCNDEEFWTILFEDLSGTPFTFEGS
ncbi:unnamed protein product, partial [Meganyctiphanes norvegica]